MQKISTVIVAVGILCSLFFVKADAVNNHPETKKDQHISGYTQRINEVYRQIDFGKDTPVASDVFEKAYLGYLNLKAAGNIRSGQDILSICNFSLSANTKRLWVIDLNARKVIYHSLVAHGQGTGEEFATHFSNRDGSHQSSLGFYITGDTYTGNNGYSLKLEGMDIQYNDHANERAIVMHGADYVSPNFITLHKRLGRSWGCPAIPQDLARPIINTIKEGTCLYIYYPDSEYLASSKWLNSSSELPGSRFIATRHLPLSDESSRPPTGDSGKTILKPSRMLAAASLSPADDKQYEKQESLYQGVHLEKDNPVE